MDNYQFERTLVSVLAEIIDSRGLKHEPVAELAWPGRKDAGRSWQDVRNKVPPQKLSVRDAYGLAQALGISMSALCGIVEGRAIEEAIKGQLTDRPEKKEISTHITSGRPTQTLEADPSNIN